MSLLKEAIAEAKAVKKLAEASAMEFLKESLGNDVKGLVSKKLAEEEEEDTMPVEDEIETPVESPEEVPEAPESSTEEPVEEADDEFDLDEILKELDDESNEEIEEPIEEVDEVEDPSDDELDEILKEIEDEMEDEVTESCDDEDAEMKSENKRLKRELAEAMKVINAQKITINEVGLLSARLLYANKILSKFNLSTDRKIKVLESFDRVQTIREAKLVYSTVCESLISKEQPKRVVESIASKKITSVGKVDKPKLTEVKNSIVNIERFQKLAGIKN